MERTKTWSDTSVPIGYLSKYEAVPKRAKRLPFDVPIKCQPEVPSLMWLSKASPQKRRPGKWRQRLKSLRPISTWLHFDPLPGRQSGRCSGAKQGAGAASAAGRSGAREVAALTLDRRSRGAVPAKPRETTETAPRGRPKGGGKSSGQIKSRG